VDGNKKSVEAPVTITEAPTIFFLRCDYRFVVSEFLLLMVQQSGLLYLNSSLLDFSISASQF
jgi:hypothetical protein